MGTRIEKDSMGEMPVPEDALWGASTQRAVLNFKISTKRIPSSQISAIGIIKGAAAEANHTLGLLDSERTKAITAASEKVARNELDQHFVVDVFQTGSGTSTNMNANEVICNVALDIAGKNKGAGAFIHPNDHVNMCQSSNDVFPSSIHIAAFERIQKHALPELRKLHAALETKQKEFESIVKCGRTHLQDATPITLGQEFSGFASQIASGIERIEGSSKRLLSLALGGTAVGTGLNTHPEFAAKAIAIIAQQTGSPYFEAKNHFEAQATQDSAVEVSAQLRTVAVSLMKISNDIRWLSSGPRGAVGELFLPEIQPGSSIMPAKVNPVICESVMMTCAQIMGNDQTVFIAAQHGNFELNVMMPVLAYNLLESIDLLGSVAKNFNEKCVVGITANEARCLELAEKSLAMVTSLAPKIGYDKAAELAKKALKEDTTVREAARSMKVLDDSELDRLLDLLAMTRPGL